MATKAEELKAGCIAKAADDEPVFVLRAQDMLAPGLVRQWAEMARFHGCGEAKVREALHCAAMMDRWQNRKHPD